MTRGMPIPDDVAGEVKDLCLTISKAALDLFDDIAEDGTISGAQPLDDIGRAQMKIVDVVRDVAAKRAAERGLL